ncbi:DUF5804 family protein [Natrinema halophilum]|uniref:Uncharacterized protein n=1 Tax=Natrinema halophilum TaxID=1699371 RepID=A0A7D5GLB3_9EURY|nr:DUF5804 family protein [Natrinema halophilum]QLG47553.1 DUF5804 family protein [Natrinema halophilum]
MTRVCLIGEDESTLRYELLSRETARDALSTYDLERPFENSLAVRTVSVGAAVSLLNDLDWYLTRFVDEALVQEPSVSEAEWLSRPLARQLRNGTVDSAETAEYCKIYGLERVETAVESPVDDGSGDTDSSSNAQRGSTAASDATSNDENTSPARTEDSSDADRAETTGPTYRLVEPLYVRRTDDELPEYDLRDVEDVLVVRLTEAEYTP